MPLEIRGPVDAAEMRRFLDTFMYEDEAFLLNELVRIDAQRREVDAVLDTTRSLPLTNYQRSLPGHPAHMSGGDIILTTACLGCIHAWFFHGVRWDEGWTGFGNRIYRADFKQLAHIGPPMELSSRETQYRAGRRRVVLRFEFEFKQAGELVYYGDQSAMFVRGRFDA